MLGRPCGMGHVEADPGHQETVLVVTDWPNDCWIIEQSQRCLCVWFPGAFAALSLCWMSPFSFAKQILAVQLERRRLLICQENSAGSRAQAEASSQPLCLAPRSHQCGAGYEGPSPHCHPLLLFPSVLQQSYLQVTQPERRRVSPLPSLVCLYWHIPHIPGCRHHQER